MLYCFSDLVKIDDDLINKKLTKEIDPLYSIDYLLNDIKKLENDNNKYEDYIKKHLKQNKKHDFKDIL